MAVLRGNDRSYSNKCKDAEIHDEQPYRIFDCQSYGLNNMCCANLLCFVVRWEVGGIGSRNQEGAKEYRDERKRQLKALFNAASD